MTTPIVHCICHIQCFKVIENVEFESTYIAVTRKYPLHGYNLGVLKHTTALDQLWGDDETLNMWF